MRDEDSSLTGLAGFMRSAIETMAARSDEVAVDDFHSGPVTYREFLSLVSQVADVLESGCPRGSCVGVLMSRSIEAVASLWATVALGYRAIVLDAESPRARVDAALSKCDLVLVRSAEPCTVTDRPTVTVRFEPGLTTSSLSLQSIATAQHPIIVQTSGSSGSPRLVALSAASLHNRFVATAAHQPLNEQDSVLLSSSPAFDYWVWEAMVPLAAGASVRLVPHPLTVGSLARLTNHVTVCHFVPSIFRLTLREIAGTRPLVHTVYFGGEALSGELLAEAFRIFPTATIFNQYGPAEMTIDTHCYECRASDVTAGVVPIGRPFDGLGDAVVDERGCEVEVGEVGELLISGVAVTNLILEPQTDGSTGPTFGSAYRTGDLVRRRADNVVEFVCRADAQRKVLGVRVYPAEVERAALGHPLVDAAQCVLVDDHLALLVASREPGLRVAAVRAALLNALPPAAIPSVVELTPAIPLLPSGKVDHLAVVELLRAAAADVVARDEPDRDLGTLAHDAWTRALDERQLQPDSNFFGLGGNSLAAAEVTIIISDVLGVEVPLSLLFEYPKFADFVDQLRAFGATSGRAALTAVDAPAGSV